MLISFFLNTIPHFLFKTVTGYNNCISDDALKKFMYFQSFWSN